MKSKTYEEFVEKFKPKKTTDDCYTPQNIYEAVKNWVVKEYNLKGYKVERPFCPGGNYQNYDYSEKSVVIDNPPFSILSEIKKYYAENKIKFFLFAPHLTLFSSGGVDNSNYIVCDCSITYENDAKVATSFCTNMGESFIKTAPELKKAIEYYDGENKRTKTRPKYIYPQCIISSATLGKITTLDFSLNKNECYFIRQLESQKIHKKAIFGGGFIISELKAKELKAKELKAKELKVEELAITWELSEKERQTQRRLDSIEKR